jgi:hypothetical protein
LRCGRHVEFFKRPGAVLNLAAGTSASQTIAAAKSGYYTLKFCMVDPGIMLQKLVVNLGKVKPRCLGPPESYCKGREQNRPAKAN